MLKHTTSNLFFYEINYKYINHASPNIVRQLSEWFLILSLVSNIQKLDGHRYDDKSKPMIYYQKLSLRTINFLILGLELAIMLKNFAMMKRLIYEIYDCLRQYLVYNTLPPIIQYVLIYTHQAIRHIPIDQMDTSTRRIGACIAYETTKDILYKLPNLQNKYFQRLITSESLMGSRHIWLLFLNIFAICVVPLDFRK